MEVGLKRKAPSATPSSSEGSASKKLKLLVRVILFPETLCFDSYSLFREQECSQSRRVYGSRGVLLLSR